MDDDISTTSLISGSYDVEKNQEIEIDIDGVKYNVTNQGAAKLTISYSKDTSTGEITFSCNDFKIVGQKDVAHKFKINGKNNVVYGGDLDDEFSSLVKSDVVSRNTYYGLGGNDTFNASQSDIAYGGDGDDVFYTLGIGSNLHGEKGNDIFYITHDRSDIYGGEGDDEFIVSSSSNNIYGEDGNDKITINSSSCLNNYVDGGAGSNTLIDNGTNTASINFPNANSFSVAFKRNETKDLVINGITYNITNNKNAQNVVYSINNEGQITFSSPNITIRGETSKAHNVKLVGNETAFYGGDLADKILIEVAGSSYVYGLGGDDEITLSQGWANVIEGGDGDDTIKIKNGNASIYGGDGNDKVLAYNAIYSSYIDLGEGDNLVEGRSSTETVYNNRNLSNSIITAGSGNNKFNLTGSSTGSLLTNFETVSSSQIKSDNSYTRIDGLKYNDTQIVTIGGKRYKITNRNNNVNNSVLYKYDAIEDKVTFGTTQATIECADDVEYNVDSYIINASLLGGNKNDTLTMLGGYAAGIYGRDGDDNITLKTGSWSNVFGGKGNDTITSYISSGNYYGSSNSTPEPTVNDGNDTFYIYDSNVRNLNGGTGDDTYYVNSSATCRDDYGNNIYYINGDKTNFSAGSGDDTFYVNGNKNTITGGGGDDYFIVTGKNNTIDGGTGTNYIVDNTGENTITNATVDPNSGALIFSHLDQVLSFEVDGKTYTVTNNNIDGNGVEKNSISYTYNKNTGEVILTGSDLTIDCSDGVSHKIRLKGSNNILNGGNKKDSIVVEEGSNNLINGNDGNDDITLNSENNAVDGGRGSDTITINASSDKEITGGAGNDVIQINCDNNTNIKTGTGNDTIRGDRNNNNINLDYGSNNILLKGNNNNIESGNGNNKISLIGDDNSVVAGKGANTIGINGNSNIIVSSGDGTYTVIGAGNSVYGEKSAIYDIKGVNNVVEATGGKIRVEGSGNNIKSNNDTEYNLSGNSNFLEGLEGNHNLTLNGDNNNLDFEKSKTDLKLNGNKNSVDSRSSVDKIDIKGDENTINSNDLNDVINILGNLNTWGATSGKNQATVRGDNNSLTGGKGADSFVINGGNKNYVDGGSLLKNTLCNYGKDTTSVNVVDVTPVPFEMDLQIGDKAEDFIHLSVQFNLGGFYMDFSSDEAIKENLERIDNLLNEVHSQLAYIGSSLNRLDSIYENQVTTIENLSMAKGLITDADIAQESVEFNKKSIMQQISTSLFAQTNQMKSNHLLSLIGGI